MKKLVIVTALMAEAVPVIDFYRLRKQDKQPGYQQFSADLSPGRVQLDLLVCGIGHQRTRDGLAAYLQRYPSSASSLWLNLGIAGTCEIDIGQLVWARSINGQPIGLPAGVALKDTAEIESLAEPSQAYRPGVMFDMEADSCLQTLRENLPEFAPAGLFCAKVISDSPARDPQQISRQWVTETIRRQIKSLDRYFHIIIDSLE